MLFGFFWGDWTVVVLIPAMIFAFWAQINVQLTFSRYKQVGNRRGLTAAAVARRILDANGLNYVQIQRVSGRLTDHYDPREQVVRLSDSVYDSTSVAAIGVAAHEVGHACQHAEDYVPLRIRSAIIPRDAHWIHAVHADFHPGASVRAAFDAREYARRCVHDAGHPAVLALDAVPAGDAADRVQRLRPRPENAGKPRYSGRR